MRIEPDQTFAGVSAMRVRDMMRKVRHNESFGPQYVQQILEISLERSITLTDELERQGFIERRSDDSEWWHLTLKGSALALATAANPIRRRSAEQILDRFFERIEAVRCNPKYLLRVERVDLFGSMTTGRNVVNDIDLGIALQRKEPDDDCYKELADELRHAAFASGRTFKGDAERFSWPSTHVMLFLKSRSRALSLHPLDEWVLDQPGRRTLYVHHDDAPGQHVLFKTDGL